MLRSLVGSEMCIRDRSTGGRFAGMQLLTANHHGPLSRPTWDFAANFCRNQNPANGRDGDSFPPELQEDLRKLSELHTTAINTERLSNLHRGSCEGRLDAALAAKRQAVASREACVVTLKNAMAEFDMRQSEQMACNARSNEAAATLLWVTKGEQDAVLELEAAVREGRTARQEHKAAAKTRHDTFPMARLCSVLDHATTRACLLYTSDAADEEDSVDLGGRRIIKKKTKEKNENDNVKSTNRNRESKITRRNKQK
eukprot:TRINITY_DN7307_c0_g1_i3.p1 TRINITY_DN7307_c0_g1~~TRINITY_DN7307_c0_g1_i3.p1  ORF type:complete len:256 (+),score=66.89 TRINITY_DN7307_c0_g1_i3:141-908(+)